MIILAFVFSGCSRSNFISSTVLNSNTQNSIKSNLTGYWLHDSGMYGFESYYFSPDGKGWCYGMIKTKDDEYVYGYSEIHNWKIIEDYKLRLNLALLIAGIIQLVAVKIYEVLSILPMIIHYSLNRTTHLNLSICCVFKKLQ